MPDIFYMKDKQAKWPLAECLPFIIPGYPGSHKTFSDPEYIDGNYIVCLDL